jgi:Mg-chelatase subunit ChlD
MTYLPDAGAENAPDWDENTRVLEWETSYVPKEGMTYTVRLEPQQVGYWPTNVEARGVFLDNKNRSGEFVFEVPYVTVLNPGILATPETPPVPPTHTPTPPPTVTPTPRPQPIYLPVNLHQRCTIVEEHVDIVLVLDISTSMRTLTQNGRPKIDAILDASKAFAGTIDLTPNELDQYSQVGVVGFNNDAWVELALTNDLNAIYSGLDRLPARMAEFTRLDLGVEVGGAAAVGANHKPDNEPVVVFLTDGLPNQVPYAEDGTMETTVVRAAEEAKRNGVVFYTIGVGIPNSPDPAQRINPDLLTEIAGDADRYFEAADAEGVRAIYEGLKIVRNCERQRWGRVSPNP